MTRGHISVPVTAPHCPSLSRNRPVTAASATFYSYSRPLLCMLFPSPTALLHGYIQTYLLTDIGYGVQCALESIRKHNLKSTYTHSVMFKLQRQRSLSDRPLRHIVCTVQTVQHGLDVGSGQSQIPSSGRVLVCRLGLSARKLSTTD